MLEPSHATCTPPANVMYADCRAVALFAGQNCEPIVATERSLVNGGRITVDKEAVGSTPLTCRVSWYEPKKNILSFFIGPPIVPPNWFCFRGGRGCLAAFRKKALALKMSLRTNSQASP